MKSIQQIFACAALVGSMFCGAPAHAARDFTPQAGTWVVSSELDGKPGRGLAIDVQGNTFFMQVFAYDDKGVPTFYSAIGTMEGGAVTAPLVRYAGGRSFGSEPRSAGFDSSPGNVVVRFGDGLHGVVQFPGEPELAIERFLVKDAAFEDRFVKASTVAPRSMRLAGVDGGGITAVAWNAHLISGPAGNRQLVLQQVTGIAAAAAQTLDCTRRQTDDAYDCVASAAVAGGDIRVQKASLRLVGGDVQGVMDISGAVAGRLLVTGDVVMGGTVSVAGACSQGAYTYVQDIGCYSGDVQIPSNGTWMVANEIDGKPGRGIAIDVQQGLAIAQVFNYSGIGRSTFHMGSDAYGMQETTLTLNRYEGGRAIGGAPASAMLLDSAGEMYLGFYQQDDKTKRGTRVSGVVQFPRERFAPIVRLALEPQDTITDRMAGQWLLRFQASQGGAGTVSRLVHLNQDRGGAIVSDDGEVQCAPVQSIAVSSEVLCIWKADGGKGAVLGSAQFVQQANNRSSVAMRIRDSHGNLTGLGAWE
ncbi:MAG: hypothetical protein RSD57_00735 [Comamonas sp.]